MKTYVSDIDGSLMGYVCPFNLTGRPCFYWPLRARNKYYRNTFEIRARLILGSYDSGSGELMSKKYHRFEEDVMSPAVETFLKQRFDKVLKELSIRINDFPPPSKSVRLDLIAIDKSQSLIVECKKYSTPYYIGVGIGEILIQRAILRREKTKIEKRERIQIPEPIRLGLCFGDFTKGYNEFPDGYRWKTWNQSCTELLNSLTRDLGESIAILLVKSKVVKPSYRDLLSSDLCVERLV